MLQTQYARAKNLQASCKRPDGEFVDFAYELGIQYAAETNLEKVIQQKQE